MCGRAVMQQAFNLYQWGSTPLTFISTYEVKDACETSDLVDRVRFVVGAYSIKSQLKIDIEYQMGL